MPKFNTLFWSILELQRAPGGVKMWMRGGCTEQKVELLGAKGRVARSKKAIYSEKKGYLKGEKRAKNGRFSRL